MSADHSAARYLLDTYMDWARGESLPIGDGDWADVATMPLRPWPRFGDGAMGGFAHLTGRGDFLAAHIIEIAPGAATREMSHLFDEMYVALSGSGLLRMGGEAARSVEWKVNDLFSPPVNAGYALVNPSSHESARLVCVSNLPFQMNFFRSEQFLFDNPFPPATGEVRHAADLQSMALRARPARGEGRFGRELDMGRNVLHAHVGEIAGGAYGRARRHGPGAHVLTLGGQGYSLVFTEDGSAVERHDWRRGLLLAPADDRFIQHFNTGASPARYLVMSLGKESRPLLARKAARLANAERSIDEGGPLLDVARQPPLVRAMFEEELSRGGVDSRMGSRR